jgi:hypothetical protein
LNCTTASGNATGEFTEIPCEEIVPESQLVCTCPECVRELQFTYNGSPCEADLAATGKCIDTVAAPFVANIVCSNIENPSEVIVAGEYQLGETVTMTPAPGQSCIPDTLTCSISSPEGVLAQTVELDASCDGGRGLILLDNYGVFTSVGYSCDENDTHNCLIDIIYDLEVCNAGIEEETIFEWNFILNETVTDLLPLLDEDNILLPEECLITAVEEFVNICQAEEYVATSTANATDPLTGFPFPCDDMEEIRFQWTLEPLPPTPAPR